MSSPNTKPSAKPKSARASRSFACTPRDLPNGERRLFADLDDLRADPRNARAHPPRQLDELRGSFRRFGQQKPVIVDESGKVLAGHGFLEALRLEREASVWVVISNLDDLRARAYAIADNRIAELGDWDAALLADALAELGTLEPELVRATGFDERELGELLADLDRATDAASASTRPRAIAPEVDPDAPKRDYSMQERPPLLGEGPSIARRGDVWTIGPHRIACGDCRDQALVRTVLDGVADFLLLTDPPYCSGSSQEAGKAAGTFGTIAADNLSAQGFRELIRESLAASGAQQAYFFTDWRQWPNLLQIVEGSGLAGRAMLVWDKGTPGIGAFWRPTHELILFATRRSSKRAAGAVGLGNVLHFRRARNLHHYTEKPVALLERILEGDKATGRVAFDVFDPFAGSGSTLVAAARNGRRGFGIEVEPLIVDVALRRLRDELKAEPLLQRYAGAAPDEAGGAALVARGFEQVSRDRLGRADVAPTQAASAQVRKAKKAAKAQPQKDP